MECLRLEIFKLTLRDDFKGMKMVGIHLNYLLRFLWASLVDIFVPGCRGGLAKLSFLDSNSLIATLALVRKYYFALNATNGM